jgi:hypothetical protein
VLQERPCPSNGCPGPLCPCNAFADVDGTRASHQQPASQPRGFQGLLFVVEGSHQQFETLDVSSAPPWLWGCRKTPPVIGASQILLIAPLVYAAAVRPQPQATQMTWVVHFMQFLFAQPSLSCFGIGSCGGLRYMNMCTEKGLEPMFNIHSKMKWVTILVHLSFILSKVCELFPGEEKRPHLTSA